MTFEISPGSAIGCRTNAHRHGWDGSICESACDWACGIEPDFRAKYCAKEIARCFHLHLFDDDGPHLVIPDSGVGWALREDATVFDDQILLIWAPQADEPEGVSSDKPSNSFMAGAYRVQSVERSEQRNHVEWKIHPHDDGWTFIGCLDVPAPRFSHLGGPYIKQVERSALAPLFESARKAGEVVDDVWSEEERDRLVHFSENLEEWLDIAEKRAAHFAIPMPMPRSTKAAEKPASAPTALQTRVIPTPPKKPRPTPPAHFPLLAADKAETIESIYGSETLASLRAASLTRPLVILRGAPGVGKSHLALDLIDDPKRERTLVVPVSASWRGRNDLLGYLNRGRNQFEPSFFINFLRAAQHAWEIGDYASRIVVFENFDLNPPEIWLSEILLRASYPVDCTADRTFTLPGDSVRGWDGAAQTSVFLSPAVRFVATIDDPVRSDALSGRLLDKAAVVRLDIQPGAALSLRGVSIDKKMTQAIEALDKCTRPLSAAFTFSAAGSLKVCLENLDDLGVDGWGAIDLVLRQELISKLELHAPAGIEAEAHKELAAWTRKYGKKLAQCGQLLESWGATVVPSVTTKAAVKA
ncbi:MAG TPA: hypothetical protein EYG30_08675 [Planctomycetes bacterium]|nr:hypothetical protein [Planctomycetota bacterium]HIL52311.1 hypothetical protein [Planctomycetota bacterium]